jgi:hypothetical protein
MNKIEKCEHEYNNCCYALVCYSGKKCNGRDKNGNPIYVSLAEIKKRDKLTKQ